MEQTRRQFLKATGYLAGGLFLFPYDVFGATPKEIFRRDKEYVLLGRVILGEGESCVEEEKIAIGLTSINRLNGERRQKGANSLRQVLLQPHQYDCLDPKKTNKESFRKVLYPEKYAPKIWPDILDLSRRIVAGELTEPDFGQTHYCTKYLTKKLLHGELGVDPSRIELISFPKEFKHQFYREI